MSESVQETFDNESWSATVTLSAPGVYDPDKQLDSEQVVAMKKRFRDSPELIGRAAVHIVDGLMADRVELNDDPLFDTEEELETFKEDTSKRWADTLGLVVQLPGADWPDRMTPPATFAEALKEMDAETVKGNENG
jgi:hypothetical protein